MKSKDKQEIFILLLFRF